MTGKTNKVTETAKGEETPKTEKPKAERKVQLTKTMLKAFQGNPDVLKNFLLAMEEEPETIAPILFAQAVGAARQMKISV